jgi:hypothetical protein
VGISAGSAALVYVQQGWPLVPLHSALHGRCSCRNPNCGSPAKHPRTRNGFRDATTDAEVIREWWGQWPDANIGARPAALGCLVADVDGPDGELAAERLGLLAEPTLQVVTGRGRHLYYRHPGGTIPNVVLGPSLDVRADHGYVLLPSVHPSGLIYTWRGTVADLADLPPRALAAIRTARMQRSKAPRPASGPYRIAAGARNRTLASIAGAMRRHGCAETTIAAALLTENAQRCDPALSAIEVRRIAASIARYIPASKPSPAGSWESFS